MLQVQTRKPPRTFNHHADIRTDKTTPNSMMARVRKAGFQSLLSTKTRNWHWNATDPPFHDLHKFFDVQYEERDAMENL
jgi:DNA-binding ferritin-like protein